MKNAMFEKKELKNAGWLVGGKVVQMLFALVVSTISTRYLGPKNYGLINYASSLIAFFMSFCTLGINYVIIKDFIDNPAEQGEALGTSILLRVISSFCSAVMIVTISSIVDAGEKETVIVVVLSSIALVFNSFDMINYWFQAQYKSKVTSLIALISYVVTSAYKIILLVLDKGVRWFAFASSVDYICIGLFLFVIYKKYNGPKLKFSYNKAKHLLSKSYHYIISGMMVVIYGQTDKLMLKHMISNTEVGYYSVGTTVCNMWVFVLAAIIDSMYPTILNLYTKNKEEFDKKNRQLYVIVFYVSVFVSLGFTVFGDLIISILYGNAYAPAVTSLKIITWYTAFSYLGVARRAWIVSNDKQSYLKRIYAFAAILNIVLNYFLIPYLGASGAALASLITEIFTSLVLPYCIKELRENAQLMLEALCLRKIK